MTKLRITSVRRCRRAPWTLRFSACSADGAEEPGCSSGAGKEVVAETSAASPEPKPAAAASPPERRQPASQPGWKALCSHAIRSLRRAGARRCSPGARGRPLAPLTADGGGGGEQPPVTSTGGGGTCSAAAATSGTGSAVAHCCSGAVAGPRVAVAASLRRCSSRSAQFARVPATAKPRRARPMPLSRSSSDVSGWPPASA
mmetsp:Transcript_106921/g.312636  ORF Transcript_106921/g.312636 Transcript_106921/m.312636 type:complete len:201 (+) Transcript_106921:322-924(+)